jgi:hypothetical protein
MKSSIREARNAAGAGHHGDDQVGLAPDA